MTRLTGWFKLEPISVDQQQVVIREPPFFLPSLQLYRVVPSEVLEKFVLCVIIIQGVLEWRSRYVGTVDRVDESLVGLHLHGFQV